MMLCAHIGMYKAGSSFLQFAMMKARGDLQTAGVLVPSSSEDAKMAAGEISPGNAFELVRGLIDADEDRCVDVLTRWASEARSKGCGRTLISAEAMVHNLATREGAEMLVRAAKRAGFEQTAVLVFLRDLTDHALSTYKHRAKPGKIPDLMRWVDEVYETPSVLRGLLEQATTQDAIRWSFRRYEKDSERLLRATFTEWLGVDPPRGVEQRSVNASLTLSEIQLMNHTRPQHTRVMDQFVARLKRLPMADKARDRDLEQHVYAQIRARLQPHQRLVDALSERMPNGERLTLGRDIDDEALSAPAPPATFSSAQLEAYAQTLRFLESPAGRALRLRRLVASRLPRKTAKSLRTLIKRATPAMRDDGLS